MRVKVTEDVLRDAGYDLVKDDTITVPEELGTKWCICGWAEDTEGNVATGERVVMGHDLEVQAAAIATATIEKGA